MVTKKTKSKFSIGSTICCPINKKYDILENISNQKIKDPRQIVLTPYQHQGTFIVKSKSQKLYYILKCYSFPFLEIAYAEKDWMEGQKHVESIVVQLKAKVICHPNLVQSESIFYQKPQQHPKLGFLLLLEEYCQEGDLSHFIKYKSRDKLSSHSTGPVSTEKTKKPKRQQLLNEKIISRWLLQILLALECLHFNKLTHQFLYPKNIYLTPLGNIKLSSAFLLNSITVLLNSITVSKQIKKNQNFTSILEGYEPMLKEKKFKINEKKDIEDFGMLILYLCSFKYFKEQKKGQKLKLLNHLSSFYSLELNSIYASCMNVKKTPIQINEILKTTYFLSVMRDLITDDKNLTLQAAEKIPIKIYTIHKKSKFDKVEQTKKMNQNERKAELKAKRLPQIFKIAKHFKLEKLWGRKPSGQNETASINTIKHSQQKLKQKIEYNKCKSLSKEQKVTQKNLEKQKQIQKIPYKQKHKILSPILPGKISTKATLLPPPSLPKSKVATNKSQDSKNTTIKSESEDSKEINKVQNLSNNPLLQKSELQCGQSEPGPVQFKLTPKITFGKKSILSEEENIRQDQILQYSIKEFFQNQNEVQLAKVSESLSKIFSDLKIRQDDDDQLSFELDEKEEDELRLTLKQEKDSMEENSLISTYKDKFDQMILELQLKYQPQLQTIIEKTKEWDSNDIFLNRELLKNIRNQDQNTDENQR